MAIDNQEKRKSVVGISTGWGVTPNTSKDAEWRQQVGWTYSGIAASAPSSTVVPVFLFHYMQQGAA